jgi:hypothetical protein
MGQQPLADELLAAVSKADAELTAAILVEDIQIKNKRGIEIHGMLRKIKDRVDNEMSDADPDKKRVEDALMPVARMLLWEIFDLHPDDIDKEKS